MAPASTKVTSLIILIHLVILGTALIMPGGWFPVNVHDEEVKIYADFAVGELNKVMKFDRYFKRTNIKEAWQQIVAGTNNNLTIELSPTTCVKSSKPPVNVQLCPLLPSGSELKPVVCIVQVYVPVLDDFMQMTNYECREESG